MSAVEHAVIAAAGLGSRLGLGKPKCLLEIGGISLLARQLALLESVPDVRIVVGFEEEVVMSAALAIRRDIVFVRNPAYRSTATLASYALGANGIGANCLFMDADIFFDPLSFEAFLDACRPGEHLIAMTQAKTSDAVFVDVQQDRIQGFSRDVRTDFEWANLCWCPPGYFSPGPGAVYSCLEQDLPLPCKEIVSYEVDTPRDYEQLRGMFEREAG